MKSLFSIYGEGGQLNGGWHCRRAPNALKEAYGDEDDSNFMGRGTPMREGLLQAVSAAAKMGVYTQCIKLIEGECAKRGIVLEEEDE